MKRKAVWVPLLNTALRPWAGESRAWAGVPVSRLEERARALEKTACQVDPEFLGGMAMVWDAFATAENVSPLGRLALRQDIVRRLAIRLRMQQESARWCDDVAARPIHRPVFVVGLPRSGTTLLHRLLADAPALRAPRLYELNDPRPRGTDEARRIRRAHRIAQTTHALAPAMRAMHPLDARSPEECSFLLPHGLFHHTRVRVPGYLRWLESRDFTEDYRYFGRQLRFMDTGTPSRWVVKCPSHLWALEAIFSACPDATVVWVHRNPQTTLPSWCSLTETTMGLHTDRVDLALLGQDWLRIWSQATVRATAARQEADPERFIDVSYRDLVADPAGTAAQVLARLGMDHRPHVPARDRRTPDHLYTLERYGLDSASVHRAFADYLASTGNAAD